MYINVWEVFTNGLGYTLSTEATEKEPLVLLKILKKEWNFLGVKGEERKNDLFTYS